MLGVDGLWIQPASTAALISIERSGPEQDLLGQATAAVTCLCTWLPPAFGLYDPPPRLLGGTQ
jgi:hypothetical protein